MNEKEKQKKVEPSDSIVIKGYVTIWQGEGKDKKIICRRKENHWVDQGMRGLISALIGWRIYVQTQSARYISFWCYSPAMYLGTDTVTATTHAMTALTSPIGASPGTAPNSMNGVDLSNPSAGVFKAAVIAQWLAGTVSGTVGELALYLRPFTDLAVGWYKTIPYGSGDWSYSRIMVSRLSEADTDFSSFVIAPSKSLTVQWELEVSFA